MISDKLRPIRDLTKSLKDGILRINNKRMHLALEQPRITMPDGLNRDEMRQFIIRSLYVKTSTHK